MKNSTKKYQRIDKILSNLGYCSRSKVKELLSEHRVSVMGKVIKNPSLKVEPSQVVIDNEALDHPDGITILLNKPAGYVCSHNSSEGRRVYDLLPERWMKRNPVPVTAGRLDKDTTGALLITDNTQLVHRLTSPRQHVQKKYRVTVDKPLNDTLIVLFSSGTLTLPGEEKPCLPADLTIIDEYTADLTLTEGRYHQVKRMFATQGYSVEALHRMSFAEYTVKGLKEGEWVEL
ncbi:pseudouridine synthase [Chitinispirillales bacterium ANBcel5]|uniref:pseudouridine synthase n=1 Tax=Cellulosispirillum alkaliphilum TaxID=3039283 RepID=UPI002A57AC06|nr:pseudouridine synthase [Chitinispirillales bacterium ANBcel5]